MQSFYDFHLYSSFAVMVVREAPHQAAWQASISESANSQKNISVIIVIQFCDQQMAAYNKFSVSCDFGKGTLNLAPRRNNLAVFVAG